MAICFVIVTNTGVAEIRITYDGKVRLYGHEGDDPTVLVTNGVSYSIISDPPPPFEHNNCVMLSNGGQVIFGQPPGFGSIYHYTDVNSAISILGSGELRAGSLLNANDDRERQQWWFDMVCKDHTGPSRQTIELSKKLGRDLKEPWRFISFSNDGVEWLASEENNNGMGWAQPSMWAHYSKRHRLSGEVAEGGAVLVFDRRKFLFYITESTKAPVIMGDIHYFDKEDLSIRRGLLVFEEELEKYDYQEYVGRHLTNHWKSLYLTKYSGWSYERETRVLINAPFGATASAPIASSLKEVLLGDGATDHDMQQALQLVGDLPRKAEDGPVKLYKVCWRNGLPIKVPINSGTNAMPKAGTQSTETGQNP